MSSLPSGFGSLPRSLLREARRRIVLVSSLFTVVASGDTNLIYQWQRYTNSAWVALSDPGAFDRENAQVSGGGPPDRGVVLDIGDLLGLTGGGNGEYRLFEAQSFAQKLVPGGRQQAPATGQLRLG